MIKVFALSFLLGGILFASSASYDAIAKIRNCSASVVKFTGQNSFDKALLLTNGHCVSNKLLGADAIVDAPYRDVATIYRGKTPLIVGSLVVDRIVYATMSDTDVAILRTNLTYDEIKQKLRIMPKQIAKAMPSIGDSVDVVSGNLEQSYHCKVSGSVALVKEDKWQWRNVVRIAKSSECQIVPGASGSPVTDLDGKITALINTGNNDGLSCVIHNPCEIDSNGAISVVKDAVYAVDVEMLDSCFVGGKFEFSDKCTLAKPQIHMIHSILFPENNHKNF